MFTAQVPLHEQSLSYIVSYLGMNGGFKKPMGLNGGSKGFVGGGDITTIQYHEHMKRHQQQIDANTYKSKRVVDYLMSRREKRSKKQLAKYKTTKLPDNTSVVVPTMKTVSIDYSKVIKRIGRSVQLETM